MIPAELKIPEPGKSLRALAATRASWFANGNAQPQQGKTLKVACQAFIAQPVSLADWFYSGIHALLREAFLLSYLLSTGRRGTVWMIWHLNNFNTSQTHGPALAAVMLLINLHSELFYLGIPLPR